MQAELQATSLNLEAALDDVRREIQTLRAEIQVLPSEIRALRGEMKELGIRAQRTRARVSSLDSRFARAQRAAHGQSTEQAESGLQAESSWSGGRDFDYVEFERAFRGPRDEIKNRQRFYLPLLEQAGIGTASMPILDLGCGRGEWLELLNEAGLEASGVDIDQEMLGECRRRGLRAELSDACSYLRTLPEGILGAATAFQVVEHLPLGTLMELIDEITRTLKPGGICILEAPNPANIIVATQGFYLDPTHLRPIPSALLRYLVQDRGLCDVYVEELNPYPGWAGPLEGDSLEARFNRLVSGPRDYAVIGRKV